MRNGEKEFVQTMIDQKTYAAPPVGTLPMPVGVMGLYIYNGLYYVPIGTVNQDAFSRNSNLFLVVEFEPTAQGLTNAVIGESIDIKITFDAFQKAILNPQLIDGSRVIEECTDYPGSARLWLTYIRPPQSPHVSNEILLAPAPTAIGEHFVDVTLTDKITGAVSKQRFEYIVTESGGQRPIQ